MAAQDKTVVWLSVEKNIIHPLQMYDLAIVSEIRKPQTYNWPT